jgi:hypothetical protein
MNKKLKRRNNMLIEIDDRIIPEKCSDCDFIIYKSINFGRTHIFKCVLIKIGDNDCEYTSEIKKAEIEMRKNCPLLRK